MIRAWTGIALLAGSWLFGLNYYYHANWAVWVVLVVAGTLLLAGVRPPLPARAWSFTATVLMVPAFFVMSWPWRVIPLLLVTGLALTAVRIPRRWPGLIGGAAATAGAVLLMQWLGLAGYETVTARSHELPWPLVQLVGWVPLFLGITAAVDGSNVVLHSMRQVHPVGATWELLIDPATLCFLIGGLVLVVLRAPRASGRGKRLSGLARSVGGLVIPMIVWLPARAGIVMSIYLHRVLRTDYDAPLTATSQFWNPWLLCVLLSAPVLLAWRFVPALVRGDEPGERGPQSVPLRGRWGNAVTAVLAGCAAALLSAAIFYDPVGEPKGGRVVVDEYHSKWEPSDRAFDTKWYGHLSGYNYYCIWDYAGRYYDVSKLTKAMDAEVLDNCDVLVAKVPTSPYTAEEVEAIRRFVERGGGLLMIGEHTNVFKTGTYLNQVAHDFGFEYRYDCLFGIDSVFEQHYRPPMVPHPALEHMPPLDFAISCSIDPGMSRGHTVILGTGLKSLGADYHASNFYPQAEDRPQMRYGAFVQLWSTRHGAGRVLAFTDSTQFSNFSTFEPGKAELMLGMLEWLNHRNVNVEARPWLALAGLAALGGALFLGRGRTGWWVVMVAAGMLGWTVAVWGVQAAHMAQMPLPKPVRPMVRVMIDRTVCNSPLSKSGFIAGVADGFGVFERWILRLGYFTSRQSGKEALQGDLVVFLHPNQTVSSEFRTRLTRYVAEGGKVLIIDSPGNTTSTANSLLWPFELVVNRSSNLSGPLHTPEGWPTTPVTSACEVTGGQPLVTVNGKPVAASVRYGKGTVTVVGFGSRFVDTSMGATGDVVPDALLQKVYDLEFCLVRAIVEDKLPKAAAESPD